MSFAIDVNILLYASDTTHPDHARARQFLERCVRRGEVFYLTWPTIMAYLRIATHPSIFDRPLSHTEAARNMESLLACPHVRVLREEDRFWSIYRATTDEVPTRGNLVPDAHVAALLRQHGVKVIQTRDRDFLKFGFLKVADPLNSPQ